MTEPAPQGTTNPTSSNNGETNTILESSYRNILRKLGFVEIALAITLFICGFVLGLYDPNVITYAYTSGSNQYYTRRYIFTTGEGFWCGISVLVSGCLAIAAAKQNANKAVVVSHRVFKILGITFSSLLFLLASTFASINSINGGVAFGFSIIQTLTSLAALAVCITGLVYEKKIYVPFGDDFCCDSCCQCCVPIHTRPPERVFYNPYPANPYQGQQYGNQPPPQYQQQQYQQQFQQQPQQNFQQQPYQQQQPQQQFQQQPQQQIQQQQYQQHVNKQIPPPMASPLHKRAP